MGIIVNWDDDDQTVLRMTYQGEWDNDQFRAAAMEALMLVRGVRHAVYVVNDFSESEFPPLGALWQARMINQMRPPNWNGGVIIVRDSLIKSLIDTFIQVYMLARQQRRQFIVSSNEEALAVIAHLKQEKVS